MVSDNLPYATSEPVRVTPPIRIDNTIVTSVKVPESGDSAAQPTSSDAAPPRPLKSATISGMDVIATARAAIAPIAPPTTIPAAI